MRKLYVAIGVVALLAVGGVAWYLTVRKPTAGNSTMNMANSANMNNTSQSAVATNSVTIQNFAFSPAAITVKVGTVVTWTNQDSTAHTVSETDGRSGPASGNVNPGSSFSFTFRAPGTYHYHCSIHPEMIGTVTVTS